MVDAKSLQYATSEIKTFHENLKKLVKANRKNAKKWFGHSLFKKSENALFTILEVLMFSAVGVVGCFGLAKLGLFVLNPLLGVVIPPVAAGILAITTNNLAYILNNKSSGAIGRTYAKMQGNYKFEILLESLKKDYKSLLNGNLQEKKLLKKITTFTQELKNISINADNEYQECCARVATYPPKKQEKWRPVLQSLDCFRQYLHANSQKFEAIAERLTAQEIPYVISEYVEDQSSQQTIQQQSQQETANISDFEQFKRYLLHKHRLLRSMQTNHEQFLTL